MNTINNKRKQESINKIETTFIKLLENKNISDINITDICTKSKINRSTFYSNFESIYDLTENLSKKLKKELSNIYIKSNIGTLNHNFLKLFNHIKDNKNKYKLFYKLGHDIDIKDYSPTLVTKYYDDFFTDYHLAFINSGINGIIKKWINSDLKETPEDLCEIIKNEYKNKTF